MFNALLLFVDVVLRGIAQVFLCNHPLSGLFICVGLACSSAALLGFALLGTVCATLGAQIIARPSYESDVASGLCGYDGALVGCAMLAFFDDGDVPGARVGIAILLSFFSGFMHVACANMMNVFNVPAFTLSFNLITISFLLAISTNHANVLQLKAAANSSLIDLSDTQMSITFVLESVILGVSQFMFVDTLVGGFFVLTGILIASRYGFCAAMLGSLLACLFSYFVFQASGPEELINIRMGLYGYNSAGTCAALAGHVFFEPTLGGLMVAAVGSVLCVLILLAFQGILGATWGLPVLTFPFICTTYLMLLTRTRWLVPIGTTAPPKPFVG